MAYTNVWDETAPSDTSLASLLGQDIRTFKLDTRQRMCMSGTLANRPTPEAVFVGLLYFSTDTAQIFQWSGTAWVDVTSTFKGGSAEGVIDAQNVTVLGNDQLGQVFVQTNIPPLAAGHGFRVKISLIYSLIVPPPTIGNFNFNYGGAAVGDGYSLNNADGGDFELTVVNRPGSRSSQITVSGTNFYTFNGVLQTVTAGAEYDSIDTTQAWPVQWANTLVSGTPIPGNMQLQVLSWIVELI